tara:strand:+ start:16 stop:387 length:372 start_codon:yes stop_codon:yes gene_type:complete
MKLSKSKLKEIIREEIQRLNEGDYKKQFGPFIKFLKSNSKKFNLDKKSINIDDSHSREIYLAFDGEFDTYESYGSLDTDYVLRLTAISWEDGKEIPYKWTKVDTPQKLGKALLAFFKKIDKYS